MPMSEKDRLMLATATLHDSMEFFEMEAASPVAERRLADNVSNTFKLYEVQANAPSPLPYQVEFVAAWKKADCYLRQLRKARMEGPIGQHNIDRPPSTPMPSEPVVELEEGDDLLPPEDDDQVVSSASTMPTVLKVGLLGFVGYLGYRVIKGK